jgi:hypothetical protein
MDPPSSLLYDSMFVIGWVSASVIRAVLDTGMVSFSLVLLCGIASNIRTV